MSDAERKMAEAHHRAKLLMPHLITNDYAAGLEPATAYALVERCNLLGIPVEAAYEMRPGAEGLCWVALPAPEIEQ